MPHYIKHPSPLGEILIVADDTTILGLYFAGQKYYPASLAGMAAAPQHPLLKQAAQQLDEYFAGRRRAFDLPLAPAGTPFQRRVWQALSEIGAGETSTYGQLAAALGVQGAARAVGAAVGRNPISVVIPCHRVVGASGQLTGYAGGVQRKAALLQLERPAVT